MNVTIDPDAKQSNQIKDLIRQKILKNLHWNKNMALNHNAHDIRATIPCTPSLQTGLHDDAEGLHPSDHAELGIEHDKELETSRVLSHKA